MKTASNPPWADELFRRYCGKVNSYAAAHNLPMPMTEEQLIPGCDLKTELGQGHYGAAYKTDQEDIVFKVTSDITEAHFIKSAIKLRPNVDPDGIVRYLDIVAIPERHFRRNLFLIWREEAIKVGLPSYGATHDIRELNELLYEFRSVAMHARKLSLHTIKSRGLSGYWKFINDARALSGEAQNIMSDVEDLTLRAIVGYDTNNAARRMAWLLAGCLKYAWDMENASNVATYIGNALREYLGAGLLLADVHAGNVGTVQRYGFVRPILVITDPGHAVVLKESLSKPEIKVL